MENKCCSKCRAWLTVSCFSKNSSKNDGLQSYCKQCAQSYRVKRSLASGKSIQKRLILPPHLKRCPKCKEVLPRASFHKNKSRKDGLGDYCKQCAIELKKESVAKKPEEYREAGRLRTALYVSRNRDLVNTRKRALYRENPERFWEYQRKHRQKPGVREKQRNYAKERRKNTNPSPLSRLEKARRRVTARIRYRENPQKYISYVHHKRARLLSSKEQYTQQQWDDLVSYYALNGCCLRCNQPKKLTVDHVLPLSKGGTNSIENIQPLCRECNSAKGTSFVDFRFDFGMFAASLLIKTQTV